MGAPRAPCFPPVGIWVEPVALGGSAALVTFQHSEIPANLSGKRDSCLHQASLESPRAAEAGNCGPNPGKDPPAKGAMSCLENNPRVAQLGSELQQKC